MKKMFKQKREREVSGDYMVAVGNRYFRKMKTVAEKRAYIKGLDDEKEAGEKLTRAKRSNKSLVDAWDDYVATVVFHHKRSWKAHTRCKKQWMKNM